jgi:hypothetical protein
MDFSPLQSEKDIAIFLNQMFPLNDILCSWIRLDNKRIRTGKIKMFTASFLNNLNFKNVM